MYPVLVEFHPELILAVLLLLVSLPKIFGSFILKTSQSLALIGLSIAVFLSILIGVRWVGGAIQVLVEFIPSIYAYFLVCLHFNSRKKLKILIFSMFAVCLFVIAQGGIDLFHGMPPEGPPISPATGSVDVRLWRVEHPYLLGMKNDAGGWFYRLRGLGEINDPNDLAQLLICITPLMFFFWQKKKFLPNFAFVVLPVFTLLYGVYLTRSRGALLALIVMAIVAARRRIGTLKAILVGGLVGLAAMALKFTGGRAISAESGSDRTELWSQGLTMVKTYPLFGVGYGRFMQYASNTAHNSIVVCAAEIGLIGLYFWSFFLFPTVRDAVVLASPSKISDGEPIVPEKALYPQAEIKIEVLEKAEINRLGQLMVLSLTGFLVSGWFLSRAFVMTFFMLGGMTEVVFELARQRGMVSPRLPLPRTLVYSGGLAVSLLLLMYLTLRTLNLTR